MGVVWIGGFDLYIYLSDTSSATEHGAYTAQQTTLVEASMR